MCGRSYDPRFLFTWPIGRCSVMGPDQLSGVMGTIAREAAARLFKAKDRELMVVMGNNSMKRRWRKGPRRSRRALNMILLLIILLRIFLMMGLLIRGIREMCSGCALR